MQARVTTSSRTVATEIVFAEGRRSYIAVSTQGQEAQACEMRGWPEAEGHPIEVSKEDRRLELRYALTSCG